MDFTAHFEFLLPFKPLGRGQDRGNSGVYLQDRYELQVWLSDAFDIRSSTAHATVPSELASQAAATWPVCP